MNQASRQRPFNSLKAPSLLNPLSPLRVANSLSLLKPLSPLRPLRAANFPRLLKPLNPLYLPNLPNPQSPPGLLQSLHPLRIR
jgi:hypothetical protein